MPTPIHIKTAWFLIALWLLPASGSADEVALPLPGGLTALADYRQGHTARPAVLVLHGFLQTHHFSTVRLIVNELSEAGYSVLAPTLSLNVDRRRSSLTCDAIQTHSVERATGEIGAWVEWLRAQGAAHIILIGHSTGSNHLLAYLHSAPAPAVSAFIATSIAPMVSWQFPQESSRQQTEAEAAVAAGDTGLKRFSLGFCRNNYAAPAGDYLSYMQWDRERVLNDLKSSPVPATVVLGEADNWLPPGWAEAIEHEAIPLVRINEANHYFSGISEFDFQSSILSLVEAEASQGSHTP